MKSSAYIHVASHALLLLALSLAAVGCANTPTRSGSTASIASAVAAEPADGVEFPVPLYREAPAYPLDEKRSGITGDVNVTCIVDETGRVCDPTIVSASSEAFGRPALDAVKRWRFKPGARDGVPVPMRVHIPVEFTLID